MAGRELAGTPSSALLLHLVFLTFQQNRSTHSPVCLSNTLLLLWLWQESKAGAAHRGF